MSELPELRVLHCSSGHLSAETVEYLSDYPPISWPFRGGPVDMGDGWFIWPRDDDPEDNIPRELMAAMRFALANNFDGIIFSHRGQRVDDLEFFEAHWVIPESLNFTTFTEEDGVVVDPSERGGGLVH